MKKSEFSARVKKKQKKSARSSRYRHISASARGGDDSSHSMREIKATRARKFWYAVADPHLPTWGVYDDYDKLAVFKPHRFKQFTSEHAARQWLDDIDNGIINPVGAGFPYECMCAARLANG